MASAATGTVEHGSVIVHLALGSNVGDRESHLRHALRRLTEGAGPVTGISTVYETDPVGYADQPPFLNLVARVETRLGPSALLALTRAIEAERDRERSFRNAPRTLDIDILLYGEERIERPGLTIPHPRMRGRAFVLVPLLELEPELREPGTGRRYREYMEGPASGVRPVLESSELLEGR